MEKVEKKRKLNEEEGDGAEQPPSITLRSSLSSSSTSSSSSGTSSSSITSPESLIAQSRARRDAQREKMITDHSIPIVSSKLLAASAISLLKRSIMKLLRLDITTRSPDGFVSECEYQTWWEDHGSLIFFKNAEYHDEYIILHSGYPWTDSDSAEMFEKLHMDASIYRDRRLPLKLLELVEEMKEEMKQEA